MAARDCDTLVRELRHPDGDYSWNAARNLGWLGDQRAVDPLLDLLTDCIRANRSDPVTTAEDRHCWGAADALGMLKDQRAFEPLCQLVRDSTGFTRDHAISGLAALGDPRASEILLEVLRNDPRDPRLRQAVAAGLATLKDLRAIPLLLDQLDDDDQLNVARQAAYVLGQMGEIAFDPLVAALTTSDSRVRRWAVMALGWLNDRRAVPLLIPFITDPDPTVRWSAIECVGELGDPAAIPALIAAQNDDDRENRKLVASVLLKLGARPPRALPPPREGRTILVIDVDDGQFYLGDSAFDGHILDMSWLMEDDWYQRRLGVSQPSFIMVVTSRQFGNISVVVDIEREPPSIDVSEWDRIVEASIAVPTGRIAIDGLLYYKPERSQFRTAEDRISPHITVSPGTYRVRVHYGDQDTLDEDYYHLVLFPDGAYRDPEVLWIRPHPDG